MRGYAGGRLKLVSASLFRATRAGGSGLGRAGVPARRPSCGSVLAAAGAGQAPCPSLTGPAAPLLPRCCEGHAALTGGLGPGSAAGLTGALGTRMNAAAASWKQHEHLGSRLTGKYFRSSEFFGDELADLAV